MTENDAINIPTMVQFNKLLDSLNLSDRQRKIFFLKYSRKWRHIDIAKEVGCSKDTVGKEISIICRKLENIDFGIDIFKDQC